jgi:CubicO group peptidase (beta-lactamase class C family)
MARFYALLARGGELDEVRLFDASTLDLGRRERRRGIEPLWDSPMAYATGFELQTELALFGPAADAFGHAGAGGSRHAAWPGSRVGFSYAMNQIRTDYPDQRPLDLLDALHDATGGWDDVQVR